MDEEAHYGHEVREATASSSSTARTTKTRVSELQFLNSRPTILLLQITKPSRASFLHDV